MACLPYNLLFSNHYFFVSNLLPPLKWFHLSISQRLLCGCQLLLFMQIWNIIRALNCMLLFFIASYYFEKYSVFA